MITVSYNTSRQSANPNNHDKCKALKHRCHCNRQPTTTLSSPVISAPKSTSAIMSVPWTDSSSKIELSFRLESTEQACESLGEWSMTWTTLGNRTTVVTTNTIQITICVAIKLQSLLLCLVLTEPTLPRKDKQHSPLFAIDITDASLPWYKQNKLCHGCIKKYQCTKYYCYQLPGNDWTRIVTEKKKSIQNK